MAEPDAPEDGQAPAPRSRPSPANVLARTALLVLALVLLFPQLLGAVTRGAWPAFVLGLGMYRWAAWGACFIAMTLLRFEHLPKRGA